MASSFSDEFSKFKGEIPEDNNIDYADDFSQFKEDDVESSINTGLMVDPDHEAKTRLIAKETGVPKNLVFDNVADAEKEVTRKNLQATVQASPALIGFYSNPDNAKIANHPDDARDLDLLSITANSLFRGIESLDAKFNLMQADAIKGKAVEDLSRYDELDAAGNDEQKVASILYNEPYGSDAWKYARSPKEQRANLRRQLQESADARAMSDLEEFTKSQSIVDLTPTPDVTKQIGEATTVGEWFDALKTDPAGFFADVLPQSLVESAPGLLLAPLGMPGLIAGTFGTSFKTNYYGEVISTLKDMGVDTNNPDELATALFDPANYEKLRERSAMKAGPIAAFDAASTAIPGLKLLPKSLLRTMPTGKAVIDTIMKFALEGAAGGAGEVAGGLAADQTVNVSDVLTEVVAGGPTLITDVIGTAIATKSEAAMRAEKKAAQIEEINGITQRSKVLQRDTSAMESFIETAIGEGQTDIYIDAATLKKNSFFQEVYQASPAVREQIENALKSGGEIKISAVEYLTKISPNEFSQSLVDDIRLQGEDFTRRQAREFNQNENLTGELESEMADVITRASTDMKAGMELNDLAQKIADNANFGDNITDAQKLESSKQTAAYAIAISKRLNIPIDEVFAMLPKVQGESSLRGGNVLNQPLTEKQLADLAEIDFMQSFGVYTPEEAATLKSGITNAEYDENGYRKTSDTERDDYIQQFTAEIPVGDTGGIGVGDRQSGVVSNGKPKVKIYSERSKLLGKIRERSAEILGELGRSATTKRANVGRAFGPFSGYSVNAEIKGNQLHINYYGKEQAEQGLTEEPAVLIKINDTGEIVIQGPTANSDTFKAFQERGWAEFASTGTGDLSDYWTRLVTDSDSLAPGFMFEVLADAHARMREYLNQDRVGLNWKRYTGSTGNPMTGRRAVAFFQGDNQAVGERKKRYTNNDQLQMFLDNGPVESQAGQAAAVAQQEAVDVVELLGQSENLLALSMSSDLAARQRANLVGQKIKSPADLAFAAQIYRDPRFETFRTIFVNKKGKVVAQVGVTNRMPAAAAIGIGTDVDAYFKDLSVAAKKAGATGYYILHNHPSGMSRPSNADIHVTGYIPTVMDGLEFKSHVVIDTNQYSTIDKNGVVDTLFEDFGQPEPFRHPEFANFKINGASDVVRLSQQLQVDDGAVTIVHTDAQFNIKTISTIPTDVAMAGPAKAKAAIMRTSLSVSGASIFAVSRDMKALQSISDLVVDAVHINGGKASSLRDLGQISGGELYGTNRTSRVSPDTTKEFDYLREARTAKPVSSRVVKDELFPGVSEPIDLDGNLTKGTNYDEADFRVGKRDQDNFNSAEKKVFNDYMKTRADGKEIIARLKKHKGTPWAKGAIEGVFVRMAAKEISEGRTPKFQSYLDNPRVENVRKIIAKKGIDGIFQYLDANGYIGHASKPVNNVSSSFLNCNPSTACAKFCYATKGNYQLNKFNFINSELVDIAVELDPVRAAQRTAMTYKGTVDYHNKMALRLFDKGDGAMHWIPYIEELNKQGIRVQIFSKNPEFIRAVPEMNLTMLSIDESNLEMADANPDLKIAFVYSGTSKELDLMTKLVERDQLQVVLPVKEGKRVLTRAELRGLKDAVPGVGPYICPIDAGVKKLPNKKTPDVEGYTCLKCDKHGTIGCFKGNPTAEILNSLQVTGKATPKEIAKAINQLRRMISESDTEQRNKAGIIATDKPGVGQPAGGDLATTGRNDEGGVQGLLRQADQLLGQLLSIYEPNQEESDAFAGDAGVGANDQREQTITPGIAGLIPSKEFNQSKPWYFSALRVAAEGLTQNKGTPEQMLAMLKKAGARQDEIDAIGLPEAMEMIGGQITKDWLVKFIASNGVNLTETVLSEEGVSGILPEGWSIKRTDEAESHLHVRAKEWMENNNFFDMSLDEIDIDELMPYQQEELGNLNVLFDTISYGGSSFYIFDDEGNIRAEGETSRDAIYNATDEDYNAGPGYQDQRFSGGKDYKEILLKLPMPEFIPSENISKFEGDKYSSMNRKELIEEYKKVVADNNHATKSAESWEMYEVTDWGMYRYRNKNSDAHVDIHPETAEDFGFKKKDLKNKTPGKDILGFLTQQADGWRSERLERMQRDGWSDEAIRETIRSDLGLPTREDLRFAQREAIAKERRMHESKYPRYESSHWEGHENVIAHIRFDTHTDAEGKKTLVIQEFQSDWAQEGRKRGFKDNTPKEEISLAEIAKAVVGRIDETDLMSDSNTYKVANEVKGLLPEYAEFIDKEMIEFVQDAPGDAFDGKYKPDVVVEAYRQGDAFGGGVVPSAPFVGKTDAWVSLSMKRMIAYASENGFDRIAWTTGEQQNDRYSLDLHVKSIETSMNAGERVVSIETDGMTNNMRVDENGIVTNPASVPGADGKHLSEVIGKELAEKILASKAFLPENNIEAKDTGAINSKAKNLITKAKKKDIAEFMDFMVLQAILAEKADDPNSDLAGDHYRMGHMENPKNWAFDYQGNAEFDMVYRHQGDEIYVTIKTSDLISRLPEDEKTGELVALLRDYSSTKGPITEKFSGNDLRIGGEGMIGFYDKIVPKIAKELNKKLGGDGLINVTLNIPKYKTNSLGAFIDYMEKAAPGYSRAFIIQEWEKGLNSEYRKAFDSEIEASKQQGFDITPKMREMATSGLPLFQPKRGAFDPEANLISMLKDADLSTFLHESGHFFLHNHINIAKGFAGKIFMGGIESLTPNERQFLDDVSGLMTWFGIEGEIGEQLNQWDQLTFEEQRPHHEQFAESYEAYLFEGNAPSVELESVFRNFTIFLKTVYGSLKEFLLRNPDAGKLNDEVRAIMDRMLATDEQIRIVQMSRGMTMAFQSGEQGGMTEEEYARYQKEAEESTEDATAALANRSIRDLKWARNARNKTLKKLQADAKWLRNDMRKEVREQIMGQPVYQAWNFLTRKLTRDEKKALKPVKLRKSVAGPVDNTIDSLFVAIAKLGGINRDEIQMQWGWDRKEKSPMPVFGAYLVRPGDGGKSIDYMAEALSELGYLTLDENNKWDLHEFEDMFFSEYRGDKIYSNNVDLDQVMPREEDTGAGILNPELNFYAGASAGRLDLVSLNMMGLSNDDTTLRLQQLGMVADNGIHPDLVAQMFGYESGDQMIQEILAAKPPKQLIEEIVDQRMINEYSDLATEKGMQEAADRAVHNEARGKFIATEANAIAKLAGKGKLLHSAAKDLAQKMVGRMTVGELKSRSYSLGLAEARSGKAKLAASKISDWKEAAIQARNQVINFEANRAAMDAHDEITAQVKKWSELSRRSDEKLRKGYDMDIFNAYRAILGEFGIAEKQATKAIDYLDKVKQHNPEMYAIIAESLESSQKNAKPLKTMTVEEFKMLQVEVDSILHLAKVAVEIERYGKKLSIQEAENALIDQMNKSGRKDFTPGETSAITKEETRIQKFMAGRAFLRRVESWVESMDLGDWGSFKEHIFQPVKDAADNYRADRAKYLRKFKELIDEIKPDLKPSKIYSEELGYTFGNDEGSSAINEILHVLLHTGNASNKRKMLLGRKRYAKDQKTGKMVETNEMWGVELEDGTVDPGRLDAFIARMIKEGKITQKHFDFVQAVWDLLEETKPLAQKTHRDVFGKYFDEVTADGFTDPFGIERRGGYIPAQVDTRIVKDKTLAELADAENQSMSYSFPTTQKGFTKARTEYNRPLLLDLRSIPQHIDKVLKFSHMEGVGRETNRILSGDVGKRLNKIDPTAIDGMLVPWLKRSVTQTVETPIAGDHGAMRLFSTVRARAGATSMMGNVANTTQQLAGFMMAAIKVRPALMASAMAEYVRSPKQFADAVASMSPYMLHRMENEVSTMNGQINDILVNPTLLQSGRDWTMKHAYFMQSALDNVMSPIIWMAGYNQAIEQGMDHERAIKMGDSVIRQTQGSSLAEDISRIEGGTAWARMFTQFAGYFNMQANLMGTGFSKLVNDGGLKKGAGRAFYIVLFGFIAQSVVSEMIMQAFRGGPEDEDDDGQWIDEWFAQVFGWSMVRNATAMVPVIGPVVNALINAGNEKPYDDRIQTSPAISMLESMARSPWSVYDAIVEDKNRQKAVRDVATAVSMLTGLPGGAVARPVGYLTGVSAGEIEPTSAADFARGVVTGVASPESKQ